MEKTKPPTNSKEGPGLSLISECLDSKHLTPEQRANIQQIESGFVHEEYNGVPEWSRFSAENGNYVWRDVEGSLWAMYKSANPEKNTETHGWQVWRQTADDQEFGWVPLSHVVLPTPEMLTDDMRRKYNINSQFHTEEGTILVAIVSSSGNGVESMQRFSYDDGYTPMSEVEIEPPEGQSKRLVMIMGGKATSPIVDSPDSEAA